MKDAQIMRMASVLELLEKRADLLHAHLHTDEEELQKHTTQAAKTAARIDQLEGELAETLHAISVLKGEEPS